MSRMAYGFVAMLIVIFVFFVPYALISPAWDTWYLMGIEMNSDLAGTLGFIDIVWSLLPFAVIIAVVIWGIVAGMGSATNPGRVCLGWLVVLAALCAIMLAYVTADPIVINFYAMGIAAGGAFEPVVEFLMMMWHGYPIPCIFAVLIWAVVQSIATEPNTEYVP